MKILNKTILRKYGMMLLAVVFINSAYSQLTLDQGLTTDEEVTSCSSITLLPEFQTNGYDFSASIAPLCAPVLYIKAVSGELIYFEWDDESGDANGFKLEVREGQAGTWQECALIDGDTYEYTYIGGVDFGVTYSFRICSFTGNPESGTLSEYSNIVEHTRTEGIFDMNYIHTCTPRVAIGNSTAPDLPSYPANEVSQAYQYFDGLGRPIQEVAVSASPVGHDIVQPIDYDEFGRQKKTYQPYTVWGNGGYRADALLAEQHDFYIEDFWYNEKLAKTAFPFAETEFDGSPLNRVLEQGAPGDEWQTRDIDGFLLPEAQRHTVKMGYASNIANDVLKWEIAESPTEYLITAQHNDAYYGANELYLAVSKDENWQENTDPEQEKLHTVHEFKDKQGNVVLKRTFVMHDADGNGASEVTPVETYYVYDDFNLLRVVIPPEAVIQTTGPALEPSVVENFCYIYNYDERKRMTIKKLPGADVVYMAYDKRDRLILTQDGNMREDEKWLFTKYDILNRPIVTGFYRDNRGLGDVNHFIDLFYQTPGNKLYEERGADMHGYTNVSFPSTMVNVDDYLTVTYYDDYGFIDDAGFPAGCDQVSSPKTSGLEGEYYISQNELVKNDRVKGLVTGTKTKILNSDKWLYATTLYDEYNRPIQTYSTNHLDGTDIVSNKYNFAGELIVTIQEHSSNLMAADLIIGTRYEYDHAGRLLETYQQIDDREKPGAETDMNLSSMSYNELGMLHEKSVHAEKLANGSYGGFLQETQYKYNIRGWLKETENTSVTGENLFSQTLYYFDQPAWGGPSQYNGNISTVSWGLNDKDLQFYSYSYDALNRLNTANHFICEGGFSPTQDQMFDVQGITYDLNGNIKTLQRKGNGSIIDDLVYEYSSTEEFGGNRLMRVTDNDLTYPPRGFKDLANGGSTREYEYDANGNMTKDYNKLSITRYNYLNLPEYTEVYDVITGGFNSLSYKMAENTYDALGNKLTAFYPEESEYAPNVEGYNYPTKHYIGNIVYDEGGIDPVQALDYIITPEGRVSVTDAKEYIHEYFIKDHLGNTRVTIKETNGGAEVLQESDYYPFGVKFENSDYVDNDNKYLYNGKELIDQAGLDWYDYGWRMYDAALGRFHVIDKMAEMAQHITPYRFGFNNPIKFFDADGNFEMSANQAQQYQRLAQYLKEGIQDIANNPKIMGALMKYGQFSKQDIVNGLKWGSGPKINVTALNNAYGEFTPGIGSNEIRVNEKFVKQLESATGADRDALLFVIAVTILHEYTHYGDDQDGIDYVGLVGNGEEGNAFELTAYGQIITKQNAQQIIEQWKKQQEQEKKKQEEENKKKQQGLSSMLSNFSGLAEGKYEWNGSAWVKVD